MNPQKVVVLLDVWNVVGGVETTFGPRARTNFGHVLGEVRRMYPEAEIKGVAFMSRYIRAGGDKIRDACYAAGFRTIFVKRTSRSQLIETDDPSANRDIDVDLTVFALTKAMDAEVLVVISGDGDYIPLYDALRERRQHVVVYSYRSSLFRDVALHVDHVYVLGEDSLWKDGGGHDPVPVSTPQT
jgi:hypothetical protein